MDIRIGPAGINLSTHDLIYSDFAGIILPGCGRHTDIAICDYADNLIAIHYGKNAEIAFPHLHGRHRERCLRPAAMHFLIHYVLDLHAGFAPLTLIKADLSLRRCADLAKDKAILGAQPTLFSLRPEGQHKIWSIFGKCCEALIKQWSKFISVKEKGD